MSPARGLEQTVAELRLDFDRSFAGAPETTRPEVLDLLLIRCGGQRYALRLSDVAAVHAERRIVAVPSPDAELLGLVGLRGSVAPVFDLALALGHPRAGDSRWLLELRSPKPCALAFSELLKHVRLSGAELAPVASSAATHRLASASAPSPEGPVAVIDLMAVYAELTGQQKPPTPGGQREGRP
jgi:purine-binding chemotaxis protein CheW